MSQKFQSLIAWLLFLMIFVLTKSLEALPYQPPRYFFDRLLRNLTYFDASLIIEILFFISCIVIYSLEKHKTLIVVLCIIKFILFLFLQKYPDFVEMDKLDRYFFGQSYMPVLLFAMLIYPACFVWSLFLVVKKIKQ